METVKILYVVRKNDCYLTKNFNWLKFNNFRIAFFETYSDAEHAISILHDKTHPETILLSIEKYFQINGR